MADVFLNTAPASICLYSRCVSSSCANKHLSGKLSGIVQYGCAYPSLRVKGSNVFLKKFFSLLYFARKFQQQLSVEQPERNATCTLPCHICYECSPTIFYTTCFYWHKFAQCCIKIDYAYVAEMGK